MITHPVCYGIIFAVLISQDFANTICNNTYTNWKGIQCFPCEPGYTAIGDCPRNFTHAKCKECQDGTYQPECDTFNWVNQPYSCRNCTVCDVYKEYCTATKNAVCELKNDDSSDDSGDLVTHIVTVLVTTVGITAFVFTVLCIILVTSSQTYRRPKVKTDYERSSNYGNKNQESHRQKRYNQKTKHCSGDVVHKTNIKEYKDKPSIHNLDCIDLAPKSNKKEKHIDVVRPHIEPKSNDDSYRCVNEYTPLDVELGQDERNWIGLSSIREEHDDTSRCEIENTPLLDVRCEIKNTPPLDVELNQDERIGVSSLAAPDQTNGYNTMYIKSGEENMLDVTNFNGRSKDQHSKYKVDDDNETTPVDPKATEKQTAVVYPYDETKSNGCKEVIHSDATLRNITRESLQGVFENIKEQGSDIKTKENQICHRSEDQSLSSMEPDKGTSELQIDWTKVFLQLSRSFSPTKWKLFAFELLSNCQERKRSVDNTVGEIELELKTQQTEDWVIHAYLKVFNKWLNNLGSARATFEHIKDAATNAFDAEEDIKLVDSIERNPPTLKAATSMCPPLVPYKFDRTFGRNYANSQQYMALHDDEAQGNSNCSRGILFNSSQTRSYQSAHCPYYSRYTTKEISNREETFVQLNQNVIETKFNCDDTNIADREQIRKRKQDQSTTQQNKMIALEEYFIRRFKDDLKADSMRILQNDYKMFMDFVIDLISNECHVSKEIVLSITYEGFCKAHQTKTKENETLYIIKSGKTSLCIGKEVFDDLALYGNVARPKLLKHLDEKKIECDNTSLLFINFEQMKNKDVKRVRNDAEKEKNAEQNFQVNCLKGSSIESCPDMNECEEHFNIRPSVQQNSSDQLFDSEKNKKGNSNNNTLNAHDLKSEEKIGTAQVQHGKKQETEKNKVKDDKRDIDIESELDSIKEWLFPVGNETYNLPNADNVAKTLNKFVDQDLNKTPSDSTCQSQV